MTVDWEMVESEASRLLSEYVRIRTVNPPGDELPAARFLCGLLEERGFSPRVFESAPNRANVVARMPGKQEGGGIILLHHMDVVPAEGEKWSVDPFGGEIRDGHVWGRGTLDMKGAGIMQLLALDALKREGTEPRGDIIYLAVADEEAGAAAGTRFMLSHHKDMLQAEYVLDEGGFCLKGMFGEGVVFAVAVAEKGPLWLRVIVEGEPGHGGVPLEKNPVSVLAESLCRIRRHRWPTTLHPAVNDFFRAVGSSLPPPQRWLLTNLSFPPVMGLARKSLLAHAGLRAMLQTTVSPTVLRAGEKENVIPPRAEATLDVRLLPGQDPDAAIATLRGLLDPGVRIEVIQRPPESTVTPYRGDPLFTTLGKVSRRLVPGSTVAPLLTPGATDSAIFRRHGYKTYGLYPAIVSANDLSRFHGTDERISLENLSFGARFIYEVLKDMYFSSSEK